MQNAKTDKIEKAITFNLNLPLKGMSKRDLDLTKKKSFFFSEHR